MLKTTLQRLVIKLMNTGYLRVFALIYFVNRDVYISLPSVREADKMSHARNQGGARGAFAPPPLPPQDPKVLILILDIQV